MFKIALSKLTPFDNQIITLITLAPSKWLASPKPTFALYSGDFGTFGASLYGFGLQSRDQHGTNKCRQLSWRGQVLLRREWRKILCSAVDPSAETLHAPPMPASGESSFPAAMTGRFKHGGVTPPMKVAQQAATAVAVQQAQMNQHMARMAQQLADKIDDQVLQTLSSKIGTHIGTRDDAVDAFKFNLIANQLGPAMPPVMPSVTAPSNAVFFGKTRDQLLGAGAPQSLVDLVFNCDRDRNGDHPADALLANWCAEHLP